MPSLRGCAKPRRSGSSEPPVRLAAAKGSQRVGGDRKNREGRPLMHGEVSRPNDSSGSPTRSEREQSLTEARWPMAAETGLIPTPPISGSEFQRWSAVYAGDQYYYGSEPGPVARRAVRYHRQYRPRGGTALDAGCGEGQDLAFLAERGYV